MPQGLMNFVIGQGQSNDAESSNGKDLARRRQAAVGAKITQASFYKASAPFQTVPDRHAAPVYVQQSTDHQSNGGDLFDGSVLDDSDDTARDLHPSNMRGYQTGISSNGERKYGDGMGVEHYEDEEEEHDYDTNPEGIEDGSDDQDGQLDGLRYPANIIPMRNSTLESFQERAIGLRDSQLFADAQNQYNSKLSLNRAPHIHGGISGRFASATNFVGDVPGNLSELEHVHESLRKSHPQRNSKVHLENSAGGDRDERIRGLQHETPGYVGQLERSARNRVIAEHNSNGMQQAEDSFSGSERGSVFSGRSGQLSSRQHTPRAHGQPNKQTRTSSQPSKRKPADLELDYEANKLSTMSYSELRDQPFDSNPRAFQPVIPELMRGPEASLEDHLELFRGWDPDDQASFFAQMPMDQWEESGDWFLGRFGHVMSKLKDARRAKRDVSKAFEEELASREEAVRGKAEGIQEVFRQMRTGGEGVLRGRPS